jgi:hypothetical protein
MEEQQALKWYVEILEQDKIDTYQERCELLHKLYLQIVSNGKIEDDLAKTQFKAHRYDLLQPYISKMFGWANFFNWVSKEAK